MSYVPTRSLAWPHRYGVSSAPPVVYFRASLSTHQHVYVSRSRMRHLNFPVCTFTSLCVPLCMQLIHIPTCTIFKLFTCTSIFPHLIYLERYIYSRFVVSFFSAFDRVYTLLISGQGGVGVVCITLVFSTTRRSSGEGGWSNPR